MARHARPSLPPSTPEFRFPFDTECSESLRLEINELHRQSCMTSMYEA